MLPKGRPNTFVWVGPDETIPSLAPPKTCIWVSKLGPKYTFLAHFQIFCVGGAPTCFACLGRPSQTLHSGIKNETKRKRPIYTSALKAIPNINDPFLPGPQMTPNINNSFLLRARENNPNTNDPFSFGPRKRTQMQPSPFILNSQKTQFHENTLFTCFCRDTF